MSQRIETRDDLLGFYRTQTEVTDPGPHAGAYAGLPEGIPELCRAIQRNVIHMWWIGEQTYGFTREELEGEGRKILDEISLRSVGDMLDWILRESGDTYRISLVESGDGIG